MKYHFKFILSAAILAARVNCLAQVIYSSGIYAGGTTYCNLSSTTFSYPPYIYTLTGESWMEDTNGYTTDIVHKAPGDVLRHELEVQCGAETFFVPWDCVSQNKFRGGEGLPASKGSGDLTQLVMQCVTNRGGNLTSNTPPVVQSSWARQSRNILDIIVLHGDHFTEVQKLLEQTYGKPDARIHSSGLDALGHSLTYTPDQIGVVLNLTANYEQTIVSVIAKQKP